MIIDLSVCFALFAVLHPVTSSRHKINVPIISDEIAACGDAYLFHNHNKFNFGVQVSDSVSIQLSVDYEGVKLDSSTDLIVQLWCMSLASSQKEGYSILTFPQKKSEEITTSNACVPFVWANLKAKNEKCQIGKENIWNSPQKELPVTITVKSVNMSRQAVHPLNVYYFSKEDLSARVPVASSVCKFYEQINNSVKYSFIDSPNAQVLLDKYYDKFGSCQQMFDSVKQLNDMIEYFDYLTGLDAYRFAQIDSGRFRPSYFKLFYKAECDISPSSNGCTNMKGAYAFYTSNRIGIVGRSVVELIGDTDGHNWALFHETGHHYGNRLTKQDFFDFRDTYVNIYAGSYQSRFKLDKPESYWMHRGWKRNAIQESYKNRSLNFHSDLQLTANALFAIFNSFPGLFRAYNIRKMHDMYNTSSRINSNFIAVICDFILDTTGHDLGPLFDYLHASRPNEVSTGIGNRERILPLTHRFEAQFNNGSAILFPCFMLSNETNGRHDRLRIADEESYQEYQSALTLCAQKIPRSPTSGRKYKISIIKNAKYVQLRGSDVVLNGQKLNQTFEDILEKGLAIDEEYQISVLSVESRGNMANILPTYIYKTDKEIDLSSSFTNANVPEDYLVFKGLSNEIIMLASIYRRDKTFFRYKLLNNDPHSYFNNQTYVSLKVLDDNNKTVLWLDLKGDKNTYDTGKWNYTELKANYKIVYEAKEMWRIELNGKPYDKESKIVSLLEHPRGYLVGSTSLHCNSLEYFDKQFESSKSKGFTVGKKQRLMDRFVYLQKVRSNLQNLCTGKPDNL